MTVSTVTIVTTGKTRTPTYIYPIDFKRNTAEDK